MSEELYFLIVPYFKFIILLVSVVYVLSGILSCIGQQYISGTLLLLFAIGIVLPIIVELLGFNGVALSGHETQEEANEIINFHASITNSLLFLQILSFFGASVITLVFSQKLKTLNKHRQQDAAKNAAPLL